MIEIISEFVVKEEARGQFELAFGPGGAWSKLFAEAPGFRGITLLRDENHPGHYLTIEMWDTVVLRDEMLASHQEEYASLLETFYQWSEFETQLGVFRMMAEASVRARPRSGSGRG